MDSVLDFINDFKYYLYIYHINNDNKKGLLKKCMVY